MSNIYAQDIDVFQQFYGRYSYTAIGNTLNPAENNPNTFCQILPQSTANLNMSADQTVLAAYLYWAGSGLGDTEVSLNGDPVVADDTLNVVYQQGSITLDYFSCFKDVTDVIQMTGNGDYTLSDLDISDTLASNPYHCAFRTNFAGWAIIVVYEEDTLPLNQVSIYHGLEIINRNVPEINITIDNLNVLDNDGAKIGFLAWEGDNTLNYGESLVFNGNVLENLPLNPGDNAFNGTNTFMGSNTSYNMDLDVYDIENYITVGDTSATIQLTTGGIDGNGVFQADLIIINNIVTVLNSQLPDATVVINDLSVSCDNRDVWIDYTIFNVNSTEVLPANTPIAFYADGVLVGTASTIDDILIGEQESNNIVLNIPTNIPNDFTLTIVADDIGNGTGIVQETDEGNNSVTQQISLLLNPPIGDLPTLELCDEGNNQATFDLTSIESQLSNVAVSVQYFNSENEAELLINEIETPSEYVNSINPETIYIRVNYPDCFQIGSFNLNIINCLSDTISSTNGISPNGDGTNDTLVIPGVTDVFENHVIKIFNRYGTLIFEGGYNHPWSGKANRGINHTGSLLPVSTYYYIIDLNDDNYSEPLVGWVYLNY
ncbi:gliding motility-associated C-terminal domain-containing protein [Pseudofulvibacter geojedonensis]|uniref:gliding motility-associated C-terminal domain-containing protein n=1 Tax=Pseudofulvibacter geojedonensis TaxID=1123758 RepID=UPI00366F470D